MVICNVVVIYHLIFMHTSFALKVDNVIGEVNIVFEFYFFP